jgi:hypothetical protein
MQTLFIFSDYFVVSLFPSNSQTLLCFPSELCYHYQVLGNAKGAVAVVISILLFRNPVTAVGIGGYTVTVLGVIAYGEAKRRFR